MESEMEIVCEECGVTFVHVPRNQRSPNVPARCSLCQSQRALSQFQAAEPQYTGDPNEYRSPMACSTPAPQRRHRDNRRQDQRPSSNDTSVSRHPSQQRSPQRRGPRQQLFSTVCAKCGSTTHVPFQPSKFQQVLCRACYREVRTPPPAPENG